MPGRTVRFACATILAFAALPEASPAQEQTAVTRRDTYWLGAGLGVGSEDFGGQLNVSYQFGANLISFRVASTAGLFEDESTDYALLYGRATHDAQDRHQLGAALGVAVVDGCRGGGVLSGGCRDVSGVIGLPFELQAFWRPGKVVGLGVYGFANLNGLQSFGGITLSLQVGRLR
jgi:hypothetical protein